MMGGMVILVCWSFDGWLILHTNKCLAETTTSFWNRNLWHKKHQANSSQPIWLDWTTLIQSKSKPALTYHSRLNIRCSMVLQIYSNMYIDEDNCWFKKCIICLCPYQCIKLWTPVLCDLEYAQMCHNIM